MKKYSSRPPQAGLRFDGMPNRAYRRQAPMEALAITQRTYFAWLKVAAMLIPGWVPPLDDEKEAAA